MNDTHNNPINESYSNNERNANGIVTDPTASVADTEKPSNWDFDSVVIEYEKRVEIFTSEFVKAMVEPLNIQEHDDSEKPHILDVGCGVGAVSLFASTQYDCHVTATDVSPAMVQRAKSRYENSNARKTNDFECLACNGMDLPKEWTNKFHYAIGNFSVIFFPDPIQGLKEIHRCLVPLPSSSSDGTTKHNIVFSAWGNEEETAAFHVFPDALKMILPEEQAKPKRVVGSKETLTSLLKEAGFSNVDVVGPVTRMLTTSSAEEYYNRFALTSPPIKKLIARLEKEDCDMLSRLKEKVMELVLERGGCEDGSIKIPSSAYFAYGTKME